MLNGSVWFRLAKNILTWLGMAEDGPEWFKMAQNGPDWFRLAQNVPEWPNLGPKHIKTRPKIETALFEDENCQQGLVRVLNLQPF